MTIKMMLRPICVDYDIAGQLPVLPTVQPTVRKFDVGVPSIHLSHYFETAHHELFGVVDLARHHKYVIADTYLTTDIWATSTQAWIGTQVRILNMSSKLRIVSAACYKYLADHRPHLTLLSVGLSNLPPQLLFQSIALVGSQKLHVLKTANNYARRYSYLVCKIMNVIIRKIAPSNEF